MSMVFCRGCGKEIHHAATNCPQCGAPQQNSSKSSWMPIVAVILSGLSLLACFDFNQRDKDQVLGLFFLAGIGLALGVLPLCLGKPGRTLAIISVTLASLALLSALGQLH